ncbi:extracellular solute-binding protein [Treponema parvum]|uniref:extracellular solute-binding protein n=1 Tax=Treponema parvum TaxID=138851 RepID=UPI001AEBCBCB|nr:extracellular solute-binding protein [Treponema parvum]QTQ17099.1 extracellular solute-binding protein [Treponema parvum]
MKKHYKSFLKVLLLTSFVVQSVFAAGGKDAPAGSAQSSGPVVVTYYTWDDAAHKSLIEKFNETHTNIKVDAKILPAADYETKLLTLLSGRAEMDCYMEKRQTDAFSRMDNGFSEPLNSFISKAGKPIAAVEANKSSVTYNGNIIGIPWRGGSYFTYFNKNVFKKAGLNTPDYYVEKGEWTWDKFEETARAIHAADPSLIGASIYFWGSNAAYISNQTGEVFISNDGKIGAMDNLLRQIAIRKRLEAEGAMWSLIDMKVTKTHYSKQFYDGKLGMLLIGEWFPGQMTTGERDGLLAAGFKKADYGITRLPCDTPKYSTMGLPTFNSMTSYSKKKDAAFEFISWMGGEEAAAVAASFGVLPAVSSPEVEKILSANLPDASSLKYYLEPKVSNNGATFTKYGSRVQAVIETMQEAYLLNKLTDAQFKEQWNKEMKNIVDTSY